MKKTFILITLFSLIFLSSCQLLSYNELRNLQDNHIVNQEYKIGDNKAFDKLSQDDNYVLEDWNSYKVFRSNDDLNYYYFDNSNTLYRFLTYDTKSSILGWQIGTGNFTEFYEYLNLDFNSKYSKDYISSGTFFDDIYLIGSRTEIDNNGNKSQANWTFYQCAGKTIFGTLSSSITNVKLYAFFIQYE